MDPGYLAVALGQAGLVALDIGLIVFGALTFFRLLVAYDAIAALTARLSALTSDGRVHVLLLAWLFGGFLEGAAGFGTPAALVAPLLVALGFPAPTAILVTLAANSTTVTFGALGTAVRVGLEGLHSPELVVTAAGINIVAALVIPPALCWLALRDSGPSRRALFLRALPIALATSLAFTVPGYVAAHWGYEFPTIVGAASGMLFLIGTLGHGLLVPKSAWQPGPSASRPSPPAKAPSVSWRKAALPYGLLTVLLLVAKAAVPAIGWTVPLHLGVLHRFPLSHPGLLLLVATALSLPWFAGAPRA
jgi:lactate permease